MDNPNQITEPTTDMTRNIPKEYSRDALVALVEQLPPMAQYGIISLAYSAVKLQELQHQGGDAK